MTGLTLLAVALAATAASAGETYRRIRIAWVAYQVGPSPTFVDPQGDIAPANILTILQDTTGTAAPRSVRDPEFAEDRLVVRGYDGRGSQLFQSVIPDPRVFRAESGDVEGRLTGRILHRPLATFDVVLPRDPAITELRLYHPRWTGEGWELDALGKPLRVATLDAPSPVEPPPPPPLEATRPVTTILENGNPAQRVDLAILGDGYTSSEMPKFANDVQALVNTLFAQEPLTEYRRYFNVHRVDVVSDQSGADHPSRQKQVNTALDASFECGNIERVICVNEPAVNAIVGDSLTLAQADLVLVLVNDCEYGGAGGVIATASTHPKVVELVLHEVGHSFGSLADEYGGPPPPSCADTIEPSEPNVAREPARAKWQRWLDTSAGARSACDKPGIPALCSGARYCDSTLYRSTRNSKMRTLGLPYDPINTEQLVRRIYGRVSPIDSASPGSENLILKPGEAQAFTVTTPRPLTHSLNITWTVDTTPRSTSEKFTFVAPSKTGSYTVTVVVEDPTPLVRSDPTCLLKKSRSWTVRVTP